MGGIPFAHYDENDFPDPTTFRPSRFDDPKVSNNLIWPRGRQDDSGSATRQKGTADHVCNRTPL